MRSFRDEEWRCLSDYHSEIYRGFAASYRRPLFFSDEYVVPNFDQKVKITESGVQKTYGFAKYLHDSLPNATYVGFTGTPVDGTIEVFGGVVDAYTMTEAVKDGITVNLVYDGRAIKVMSIRTR